MEQILTINEEREFISKYIKKVLKPVTTNDVFTGEKKAEFYLNDLVKWNNRRNDLPIFSLSTIIRNSVYDVEYNLRIESYSYDKYIEYCESATLDNGYRIGHFNRESMTNLRCFLLSKDGSRCEIPIDNSKIETDSRDKYCNYIGRISEDITRLLTQKGTRISFRSNEKIIEGIVGDYVDNKTYATDIKVRKQIFAANGGGYMAWTMQNDDSRRFFYPEGDCSCYENGFPRQEARDKTMRIGIDSFVDMVKVYFECICLNANESIFTDEQIDALYDYCHQANDNYEIDKKKARNNKEMDLKEFRRLDFALRIRELAVNDINPTDFNTLELLFTKPEKIKKLGELKKRCEDNNINNKDLEWLLSLSKHYDKESILNDIERCKKKSKSLLKVVFDPYGSVSFNETTSKFISDYKKKFEIHDF